MRANITLLFSAYSLLLAQAPPVERFWLGELVSIDSHPDIPSYEYTVWNGVDDAFTGVSSTPIQVRLHQKVKCYVNEPRSVYIIDESGEVHETRFIRQAEMVRRTAYFAPNDGEQGPRKHKRRFFPSSK